MAKTKRRSNNLISTIVDSIEEVKGKEINILDLRKLETRVCDYFVICEGASNTQVSAIVNSINKKVSETLKDKAWGIEGMESSQWVLLDYIDVVVHIFQKQKREFYDIEGLWGDAKSIDLKKY